MDTVEKVISNDFPEIADVWEASVRATHHFLKEGDILFLKEALLSTYLPDEKNLYCIRNTKKEIIAFTGISEANIDMLFIHPTARGKGIGKRLILFAIDKFDADTVDVNEQNEQAIGFYLKMGFEVVSRDETDSMGKPYPILHMKLKQKSV